LLAGTGARVSSTDPDAALIPVVDGPLTAARKVVDVLLIPLDYVPGVLPAHAFSEPNPRLLELTVLTCAALVAFALAIAGRPSQQ